MIYNHTLVDRLLGCLIKDTTLAHNPKYPLDKQDFEESQFHTIIYSVLHNLSKKGVKCATLIDIVEFLERYEAQLNVFNDNRGADYIDTIMKLSEVDNFEYYYDGVRKLTLIRDSKKGNDDISEFWDIDKSDEENLSNIEDYSIDDIINHYELKAIEKRRKFSRIQDDTTRKKAGDRGFEILAKFKKKIAIEASFESRYLTTLFGGFNKKQLYIRSGDTSSGKSRSIVGDLSSVAVNEIYDTNENKWIENKNGGHNCLYIGCEMELDEECDPLFWANISGIESSKIIKGMCSDEEEAIVKRAIKNVSESNIMLTDMPSFNIKKIREEVAHYKKECNIEYVGLDYMLLNNALVKEFVEQRGKGVAMRGDEVLLELSKSMKDICKEFNIGMITATQVNADIKDFHNRDYQVIRGGKGISDKATGGSISMPITEQELKLVESYINKLKERGKFGNHMLPNFVETIYKSRFSEFPKECKVFSHYNLGTMRKTEMFVTDRNFKPIDVPIHLLK